jgi:hypothetical protein
LTLHYQPEHLKNILEGDQVITRRIDRGLEALHQCEATLPQMAALLPEGSQAREAVQEAWESARRGRMALVSQGSESPEGTRKRKV